MNRSAFKRRATCIIYLCFGTNGFASRFEIEIQYKCMYSILYGEKVDFYGTLFDWSVSDSNYYCMAILLGVNLSLSAHSIEVHLPASTTVAIDIGKMVIMPVIGFII